MGDTSIFVARLVWNETLCDIFRDDGSSLDLLGREWHLTRDGASS